MEDDPEFRADHLKYWQGHLEQEIVALQDENKRLQGQIDALCDLLEAEAKFLTDFMSYSQTDAISNMLEERAREIRKIVKSRPKGKK